MILSRPQSRVTTGGTPDNETQDTQSTGSQACYLHLTEFVSTPYDYTMGAMLKNAPRGFYKADIRLKVDNAFRRFDECHRVAEIDA